MRLLHDCTILRVGDDDEHGEGIKVWNSTGMLFLGRFQNFGMKIEGVGKLGHKPDPNPGDRLVVFVDEDHRDAHWQAFREAMLAQHRVYIPDDLHAPEHQRVGLWPFQRWVARWLPPFVFGAWAIIPITYWWLDIPSNIGSATSISLVSLLALSSFCRLRKGMI